MDRRTTGWIAGLIIISTACFCGLLVLLMTGVLAGVPLLSSLLAGNTSESTPLPTPTLTPDINRATAVLPAAASTPSPYDEVLIEALQIQQEVNLLRGINPVSSIQCDFYTAEELHALFAESDPVLSLSEEEQITFSALGLYDPEEMGALDEDVPGEVLLAVLDEQQGRCSVLWDGPGQTGWQTAYARSYARALARDEYLKTEGDGCSLFLPEFDACLAERSLLEGDAFQAARQWQRQFGPEGTVPPELLDGTVLESFPGNMAVFPYMYGYEYVRQAYIDNGWAGVDSLYMEPPETTHQVMHPGSRWQQVDLEYPADLSPALDGWELANEGLLGEWLITLYLEKGLPDEDALLAAEGWGTDRFQVYVDGSPGETLLVWIAHWQTIPDAYTARTALREYASLLYGDVRMITADELVIESSPAVRIERIDLQTIVIAGPDQAIVDSTRELIIFPLRSLQQ